MTIVQIRTDEKALMYYESEIRAYIYSRCYDPTLF